jgi:hypothetical protein
VKKGPTPENAMLVFEILLLEIKKRLMVAGRQRLTNNKFRSP